MGSTLSEYIQLLDELVSRGAAFACYFLPFETEPHLLVSSTEPAELGSLEELDGREGFVFAPFVATPEVPILLFEQAEHHNGYEVNAAAFGTSSLTPKIGVSSLSSTKEEYLSSFRKFMEELESRRFSKLVLSRKMVVDRLGKSIGKIFIDAHKSYSSAFTYLLSSSKSGVWMGATPELLLKKRDNIYQTVALAGTMPFRSDSAQYMWNEKDIEEQRIVADYITDRLEKNGIGNVEVEGPVTARAAGVVHLKTTFTFPQSNNAGVGSLVNALHPTPAVCGMPKEEARDFIIGTEKHRREYYTGFTGVVGISSDTDLYVNLRCMKVEPERFALFAGGGITAKSNAEKEWQETSYKFQTLLNII